MTGYIPVRHNVRVMNPGAAGSVNGFGRRKVTGFLTSAGAAPMSVSLAMLALNATAPVTTTVKAV